MVQTGAYQQALEEDRPDLATALAVGWRAQARSFLVRGKRLAEDPPGGSRPRKKHRAAAKDLALALDNAVRCGTGLSLQHFQAPRGGHSTPPFTWPRLVLSLDQGSDNLAMAHALQYGESFDLNLSVFWDFSHAGWNDVRASLKACGRWGWFLVSMVAFNSLHGPWAECGFYEKMRAGANEYLLMLSREGTDCPLLSFYLEEILVESGDLGGHAGTDASRRVVKERLGVPARNPRVLSFGHCICVCTMCVSPLPLVTLFVQELAEFDGLQRVGAKISLNRFFGAVTKFRTEMSTRWHRYLLLLSYRAIAVGEMTGASITGAVAKRIRSAQPGGGVGSSMKAGDSELQRLRAACKNTMDLACAFLGDKQNLVTWWIIEVVGRPSSEWHSRQNTQLRSSSSSLTWLLQQLSGDFNSMLRHTLEPLFVATGVACMRFSVLSTKFEQSLFPEHPYVAEQNENAQFALDYAMALVGNRLWRTWWLLRGWPSRFSRMASERDEDRQAVLQELRVDYELFKKLPEYAFHPLAVAFAKRSVFKTAACRQLVACAEEEGWQPTPRLVELARSHASGVISSQVVEDGFHVMRSAESDGKNRSMSNHRRFDCLVSSDMLQTRHHYAPLEWRSQAPPQREPLPPSCFHPKSTCKGSGLDLNQIASFKSQPEWFSPSVDNVSLPSLDLCVIRFLHRNQQWDKIGQLWKVGLFSGSGIMLHSLRNPHEPWFFALKVVGGLGLFAWPAREVRTLNGQPLFEPDLSSAAAPQLIFVTDDTDWEARVVECKAPLWAWLQEPSSRDQSSGKDAKLMCVGGPPQPLLKLAARHAFFSLDKAFMLKISNDLDAGVSATGSAYSVCFELVRFILSCDEDEALKVCAQRVWKQGPSPTSDILDVQEAEDLFDHEERREVARVKESASRGHAEHDSWKREHSRRVQERVTATAKAKAKSQASGGRARGRHAVAAPRPLPAGELSQAQVKAFCPPGAFVWRSAKGSWNQHYPPCPRTSRSWMKYGERQAAVMILRDAWQNHLTVNNLAQSACGVKGLFENDSALDALPAAL